MNYTSIFQVFCFYVFSTVVLHASSNSPSNGSSDLWLPELEQLELEIETELSKLAHPSLNSGVGAVGYRAPSHAEADHIEWVQVDLQDSYAIDTIVIVPTHWRDTERGFVNDAFPAEFKVIVGNSENTLGTVVFEYNDAVDSFAGIAPMLIPIQSVQASWVRIEASRLSQRAFDGKYVFQLSDILVFEGNVDRALRKPITVSSSVHESPARNAAALVDGILPYLINSALDHQSRAYVSSVGIGETPSITIDLLRPTAVSGIRIHAADQSDTAPATHAGEFGLPKHFTVEASNQEDFSDATVLLDVTLNSLFEMGPFLTWDFPEHSARYIRLTALDPYYYHGKASGTRIGFAEIEVLQDGLNIAQGMPISTSYENLATGQTISALTDGLNLYGAILPQRQWLGELVRRHELETTLSLVETELSQRYAKQKKLLRWAIIAAVCLMLLVVFTVPYYHMLSYRKEVRIRERIAANLHDELGANLHAIGMLSDVAERSLDAPQRLVESVRRIRGLTERTGAAARHCTNMLEAESICEDIVLEMRQDTQRFLSDYTVKLRIEGEDYLHALPRRKRIDLYLFFKECLRNINRHAMATRVYIRVIAKQNTVTISIIDNGRGDLHDIPKSLLRRARLMGASARYKPVRPSGTHIRLKLNINQFRLFK